MQEQNFEKQVYKLMDDLVIPPSPPVWNKVEEQIRRKKDRRIILFWVLPLLLVGTGFWWMITNDRKEIRNNTDLTSTISKQNNINSTVETTEPYLRENLPASPDKLSTKDLESPIIKKEHPSNIRNNNFQVYTKKNISHSKTIKESSKNVPATSSTNILISEVSEHQLLVTDVPNEQQKIKTLDSTVIEITGEYQTEVEKTIIDSSQIVQIDTEIKNEVLASEELNLSKISSKWKFIPYLACGFSNVSKGLFDPVAAADFSGFPGTISSSGSFFSPSVPQKSNYFSAGFRIVKNLNPRLEIATGLQYNYFSTKQKIGTRVVNDTIISYSSQTLRLQDYYQNGSANRYTNKYHFITLPVIIEYQILQNLPLSIQAGVSLNRLISTNALLISQNSNIQFQNNRAWNKTQLHSFSGVQYHFLKSKSFSFKAGPFIQFSLTSLEKASNRNQFLTAAGLQTQFYFTSKK